MNKRDMFTAAATWICITEPALGSLQGRVHLRAVPRVWNWNINASTSQHDLQNIVDRVGAGSAPPLILGISFISHDMSLAATLGGEVIGVIELERLHKIRYFDILDAMGRSFHDDIDDEESRFDAAMARWVVPALWQLCNLAPYHLRRRSDEQCELDYDVGVFAMTAPSDERTKLQKALKRIVKAEYWVMVDHHHAHAALGWLDSPFYRIRQADHGVSVVLSYDGYGNDGTLRTFIGRSGAAALEPLGHAKWDCSFGLSYMFAASVVRDLAWGAPYGSTPPCAYLPPWRYTGRGLALPGSFMAYAAVGGSRAEWHEGARLLLHRGLWDDALWPSPFGGNCQLVNALNKYGSIDQCCDEKFGYCTTTPYFACQNTSEMASRRLDQDFAATVQAMLEGLVTNEVREKLKLLQTQNLTPTSLVVSGGCALNVKVNTCLARTLGLPIHVPSAPGDSGLSLGAAWLVLPPSPDQNMSSVQFAGAPLLYRGMPLETHVLHKLTKQWQGDRITNVQQLADLLLAGAIVAVVRGRAEFGPRALGHRSLLAAAHRADQKERLNRLKNRRWYRPCSPILAADDLKRVFTFGSDLELETPYMSFAPPLQLWAAERFPAIAHIDHTARPQSVRKSEDPWMHSLLVAVWKSMGQIPESEGCNACNQTERMLDHTRLSAGVLINTSLNPKGKPIVADVMDALLMFCGPQGDELDFVLVEELWLFRRDTIRSMGLCADLQKRVDDADPRDLTALPVI